MFLYVETSVVSRFSGGNHSARRLVCKFSGAWCRVKLIWARFTVLSPSLWGRADGDTRSRGNAERRDMSIYKRGGIK